MTKCPHCRGTGQAPQQIILECIGCQRKVKVKYLDTADLVSKADSVRCHECSKTEARK